MSDIDYAHLLHLIIIIAEWVSWIYVYSTIKRLRPDLIDWRLKAVRPILFFTMAIKGLGWMIESEALIILLLTPYFLLHMVLTIWFLKQVNNFDK